MLTPDERYRRLVASLRQTLGIDAGDVRNVLASSQRSLAEIVNDVLRGAATDHGTCSRCHRANVVRSSRRQGDGRKVNYIGCKVCGPPYRTEIVCTVQQSATMEHSNHDRI